MSICLSLPCCKTANSLCIHHSCWEGKLTRQLSSLRGTKQSMFNKKILFMSNHLALKHCSDCFAGLAMTALTNLPTLAFQLFFTSILLHTSLLLPSGQLLLITAIKLYPNPFRLLCIILHWNNFVQCF